MAPIAPVLAAPQHVLPWSATVVAHDCLDLFPVPFHTPTLPVHDSVHVCI